MGVTQSTWAEELEELAKEMEREYENRVKKALAQLRDVHSDQLKQKAHDFDKKFEKKVTNLQTALSTVRGQHAIELGELEENRRRLRDLAARINHLEEAN